MTSLAKVITSPRRLLILAFVVLLESCFLTDDAVRGENTIYLSSHGLKDELTASANDFFYDVICINDKNGVEGCEDNQRELSASERDIGFFELRHTGGKDTGKPVATVTNLDPLIMRTFFVRDGSQELEPLVEVFAKKDEQSGRCDLTSSIGEMVASIHQFDKYNDVYVGNGRPIDLPNGGKFYFAKVKIENYETKPLYTSYDLDSMEYTVEKVRGMVHPCVRISYKMDLLGNGVKTYVSFIDTAFAVKVRRARTGTFGDANDPTVDDDVFVRESTSLEFKIRKEKKPKRKKNKGIRDTKGKKPQRRPNPDYPGKPESPDNENNNTGPNNKRPKAKNAKKKGKKNKVKTPTQAPKNNKKAKKKKNGNNRKLWKRSDYLS